MIKVDVTTQMQLKTNKAFDLYNINSARHLNRVANHFRNQITKAMQKSTGGNVYIVTKSGKTHQASIRGNPPAVNTGRLVNSFFVKPASPTRLSSSLETNVSYAKFLEDEMNLDRPFMSERSIPFKNTKNYANRIAKDISLNVSKI
tara:strand:- start:22 stop:459 length:438 start_codon:yes stop_codon:yes gene_type:complete